MFTSKLLKICKAHHVARRMVSSLRIPCTQFTIHDISRRQKYLPWEILNLLSHTKRSQFELRGVKADFMQWDKVWQEYYLFYVCTQVKISRQFYQVVCDSLGLRPVPHHLMNIHMQAGHVGSKSGSFKTTLEYQHDQELIPFISGLNATILKSQSEKERAGNADVVKNGDLLALACGKTTFVFVDKKTRKSIVAPDWWKEMYGKESCGEKKLGPFNIVDIPSKGSFYRHKMVVRWNDTDFYKHVNYQVFAQYCFEAANQAVNYKFFRDGFKCDNDILNRKVKKMTINYIRESRPNDRFHIYVWRGSDFHGILDSGASADTASVGDSVVDGGAEMDDQDDADVLHFSIEKPSGKFRLSSDVLCQACIKFYSVI